MEGPRMKSLTKVSWLPCFYCGADEKQLKWIIGLIIGSFLMGSVCILVWTWLRGSFQNIEAVKFSVLDLEKEKL